MNTNAKFSGLVSELNELVETGLVEIRVTRSTSTGYGVGSLEGALQKQVEVQTVHTLTTENEEDDYEYVKCTETNGNGYHIVGDVYRVTNKEDEGNGKFYIEIENFEGQSGQVANIDLNDRVDGNSINYTHATEKEFYAQKESVDAEVEEVEPIKRIIFTIMGLDTEQTLQRKIEICKLRIYEIENPDPIQSLRNSDTLIDAMDGWFGTGKGK